MGAEVVWLASYPRSGNTMVRLVLHELTGNPTYSLYPDQKVSDEQKKAMGHVELPRHVLFNLKDPGHKMFIKTHELNNAGSTHPAVVIVRDGRDVCASFARYLVTKHNYEPKDILERVIRGNCPNHRWGDHVFKWQQPRPDQKLLTVKYEDMLTRPEVFVEIMNFAGFDIDNLEVSRRVRVPDIGQLHKSDPNFFHRGGSWWKEAFGRYHHELFWEIHGDAMSSLGYAK